MTCAKAVVRAILVLADGCIFVGENVCTVPQVVCPRVDGEGYLKCRSVCGQPAHAELDAIGRAGIENVLGAVMFVAHTHVCNDCRMVCDALGIEVVLI